MALPIVTQSELIEDMAERTGWSKSDVRSFFGNLEDLIVENLGEGNRVKIAGIQVEPKLRPASKKRMGRNPATGEAVQISAKPASVKIKARVLTVLARKVDLPSAKQLQKKLGK